MSLIRAAKIGAGWTATSRFLVTIIQFLQVVVLARLLLPADFGLMAIVLIVLSFSSAVSDIGISNAIIYRQDATKLELSSLYWANILTSIPLFLLVVGMAPLTAKLFAQQRLVDLIPYAAIVLLINPVGTQFRVLLQRELQFRLLTYCDVAAAISSAGVAITLARFGFGVMSLIIGQLVGTAVSTLSVSVVGWRRWPPINGFRYSALSRYLGFGLYQMAERFVTQLSFQTDQLLIGLLLGPHALGLYTVAWNLVVQPVVKINPVLTTVAFPIFSKIQHDNVTLKRGYLSLLGLLSSINAPLLVGLAAVSSIFVPVVYGSKWVDIIPLVSILSFVGFGMSLGNPVGSLLLSRGRADLGFKWNVTLVLVQVPSIYLGARWDGPLGIAFALLAMQIIFFAPNYWFLVRAIIGPCARDYAVSIATPFLISLAMGGSVALLKFIMRAGPSLMYLTTCVAFGAFMYIALNLLVRPQVLSQLKEFARA